ncbi:hypothetical protein [Roseiconus lacunae]|uniref:Uncharacterized protein n=1 Tax=Roseiconus lacunae TaxID=2605694 RepID=A0ABT7PP25_9BACT|nr:hypothetical protein [Roseiconus lacunae]MDM4017896.1 hypothetical protein [Roseiconus lacunae]
MRYLCRLLVIALLLISVGWRFDRQNLKTELDEIRHRSHEIESRQDAIEFCLFRKIRSEPALVSFAELRAFADDIIAIGHSDFDLYCEVIADYSVDTPKNLHECEILVFDVSLEAVPFHGGSYWVVIQDQSILIAFQASAIIGG